MRIIRHVIGVNVSLLLLAGAANATVLTTPAVITAAGERMTCHVVNLSLKEQSVRVEILNGSTGANLYDQVFTTGPGVAASVTSDGPQTRILYCRFTAPIPKAKLRGGIANELTGVSFPIQ